MNRTKIYFALGLLLFVGSLSSVHAGKKSDDKAKAKEERAKAKEEKAVAKAQKKALKKAKKNQATLDSKIVQVSKVPVANRPATNAKVPASKVSGSKVSGSKVPGSGLASRLASKLPASGLLAQKLPASQLPTTTPLANQLPAAGTPVTTLPASKPTPINQKPAPAFDSTKASGDVSKRLVQFQNAVAELLQLSKNANLSKFAAAASKVKAYFDPNMKQCNFSMGKKTVAYDSSAIVNNANGDIVDFLSAFSQYSKSNFAVGPVPSTNTAKVESTGNEGFNFQMLWSYLPNGPSGADWYLTVYDAQRVRQKSAKKSKPLVDTSRLVPAKPAIPEKPAKPAHLKAADSQKALPASGAPKKKKMSREERKARAQMDSASNKSGHGKKLRTVASEKKYAESN